MTKYADLLAYPLTDLYNSITSTFEWPERWKVEYVTPIPKKNIPESCNDLRNISCTELVSKIYESYVLEWIRQEIKLKANQFGGSKGMSVEHLLCSIWHEIGTSLEDQRAACLITAIDYSKAFNRLNYNACIDAFRQCFDI